MEPLQQNSALSTAMQSQVDTTRGASHASDVTAMGRRSRRGGFFPAPYPPIRYPRWGGPGETNVERIIDLLSKLIDAFLKRTQEKPQVEDPKVAPVKPAPAEPTPTQPAPPASGTPSTPSTPAPTTPVPSTPAPTTPAPSTPEVKDDGCNCTCPGDAKSIENKPTTPELKHTEGFLWKPISEKDGKLAILLPPHLTGKVKGVRIIAPDGKTTIGRGSAAGVGNGDREHFRFSKPGSHFPDGCKVEITLNDGTKRLIEIPETGERYTKK